MSIAIDLTDMARDQALLDRPFTVARPKPNGPVATVAEKTTVDTHDSSATRSSDETMVLVLQMTCTFILLGVFIATLAFTAWMLFDLVGSAINQLLMLSPNQILQGMAGP